jgi:hypothetical protein
MKITACQSLSGFLGIVEEVRKEWGTDDEGLWFRGERREYGPTLLRPKLYRGLTKVTANSLEELLELEDDLFEDFRRCGGPLGDSLPEDDWGWYFLMQHYGGPTRLLDWSDGALMALHFAIRDYPKARGDALVYALDSDWLLDTLDDGPDYGRIEKKWRRHCRTSQEDEQEWDKTYLPQSEDGREEIPLPRVPLLWDPEHVTRRFAAQRSRFMIFGSQPEWLSKLAENRKSRLRAITIKEDCIPGIKRELRGAGVTESVIFPDLDGLGREQSQLWEDRKARTAR